MAGLSEKHAALIEQRGLDPELASKLGVASFAKAGGEWVAIPYRQGDQVVNTKYRTIAGEKRFYQDAGAVKCFWNFDAITDPTLAEYPLIITEGEFDALAAMQAGFPRVVSVPDGAPAEAQDTDDTGRKYSYVTEARAALASVREIILAVDGDGPGVNLLNDLAIRLGKPRCKWVRYPAGAKDLNDVLGERGPESVTAVISTAQWMAVDGIYRMSELPPVPRPRPLDLGILPGLEKHYRVRPGDFTVLTGIPGHGKTTFASVVACQLILSHGWQVAFASFEQKPQVDHRRNLQSYFHGKPYYALTDGECEKADRWIDKNFTFIVPSEDDSVTLEWTLERCAAAIVQNSAKLIVIDPWNEMDHERPPGMTLTEYTGFAIKQFRKLASKYQVHVIVAAHPAKPSQKKSDGSLSVPTLYDISDSAHWYNKADCGIVIHRDGGATLIRIAKSRYHDQIGTPGDIRAVFDKRSHRYQVVEAGAEPDAGNG